MARAFLRDMCRSTDIVSLTLALGMRVLLAPFTGHPYDLPIWFNTGRLLAELKSPYALHISIGYTGLWPLWLGVAYLVSSSLAPGNNHVYDLIIKLPIIATDFTIPVLLVALIRQIRPSINLSPSAISRISQAYFLNPLVILAGAVWAMPDNMIAAALLLALLKLTKFKTSGTFTALAILIKPYPLVLIPPFLRYVKGKAWQFALPLAVIVCLGAAAPFLLVRETFGRLLGVVLSQTLRLPNAISPSAALVNLSSLFPQAITTQQVTDIVTSVPIRFLWLEALIALTILLIMRPRPTTMLSLIAWLRIFAVSYYVLFPAVSEQTLLPLVVLSMVDADAAGSLLGRSTYWLVSTVVTAFIVLNVPIWGFLYPVIDISITGPVWWTTQALGLIVLHVLYVVLMLRDARTSWHIIGQK